MGEFYRERGAITGRGSAKSAFAGLAAGSQVVADLAAASGIVGFDSSHDSFEYVGQRTFDT